MNNIFDSLSLSKATKSRFGVFWKIEELQLFFFLELFQRTSSEVFLDIGANVGLYSLAVRNKFPDAQIHSFEPTPETFEELEFNIKANGFESSIAPHKLALSDRNGVARFLDFGEKSGKNCIESTSIHGRKPDTREIETITCSLDDVASYSNRNTALKIDTEGHEVNVLVGGSSLLSKNRCVVQVETAHGSQHEIAKRFKLIGYKKIFRLGPDEYFTNHEYINSDFLVCTLETALSKLVNCRWN